jgi:hypothetical protein
MLLYNSSLHSTIARLSALQQHNKNWTVEGVQRIVDTSLQGIYRTGIHLFATDFIRYHKQIDHCVTVSVYYHLRICKT